MLKKSQRGQALLETLLTVVAVLVAVDVVTIAVRALAIDRHPQAARLSALEAAQNAAVELFAATAYDQGAIARITGLGWQSGTTTLTLVPASPSPGTARGFVLHYKGGGVEGDLPLTVRSVAPPPGSVIDPSAPPGN